MSIRMGIRVGLAGLLAVTPFFATAQGIVDVDTGTGASVQVGGERDGDGGASAEGEARAILEVNAQGVEVQSSNQVRTEADLGVFSANVATQHSDVAEVTIGSGDTYRVSVAFRHPGRLLGFIPVTVRSTTTVDVLADAEVTVTSRPAWWAFLVAGTHYDRAAVVSRLTGNATVTANATASASATSRARVAEVIVAEIRAAAQASAAAEGTTNE